MNFFLKTSLKRGLALCLSVLMVLSIGCSKSNTTGSPAASSTSPSTVDRDAEIVLGGYRNLAPGVFMV